MSRPILPARPLAAVALCLLSTACASPRSEVRQAGAPTRMAPRAGTFFGDVLTGDQMHHVGATTLYEGVSRLRPEFLNPSGARRPGAVVTPTVYLDDDFLGDLDELRAIPLAAVLDVRYLRASSARDRWGAACRCGAGVILVRTRR